MHTHQINPSAAFFNSDENKSIQTKKYARVQIKSRKRAKKEGGRDEKAPFLRKVYHKRNSKVSITHQRPFRCLFPALFASNKRKAVRGRKKGGKFDSESRWNQREAEPKALMDYSSGAVNLT